MASIHEPSDEDIHGFIAVTGAPHSRAIHFLKAHDKDLTRAINAYFDNPDAVFDQQSQVFWDESQFHTDKTNTSPNQGQSSFTVHPPDTLKPEVFNETAPSRPNSRVSTRGNDVGASQSGVFDEPEDEQLSRAMAISMSESQTLPGQETGTIDYGKQTFGPAIREHYETDKWAVVYPAAQTQEILLNPEPHDRKRQPNTPAFFKTPSTCHLLSALIKIIHAIPMAREALLNRTLTLQDYGHEKDWWDGTPVKVLRIVNIDADTRKINEDDVIYEAQRLMAFLDDTDRAYGSTNVLAGLDGIGLRDDSKALNFLNIWESAAARSESPLANVFESIGTKLDPNNPEDARSEPVLYLPVKVDNETSGKGLTLYEALDHMLWVDAKDDEEIYLEKVGDVFTLEVTNQVENDLGLGIEIPPIWYADRYRPSHTQQAKDMLARKAAVTTQLQNEEKLQNGISKFQKPGGSAQVAAAELLAKATEYFERKKAYQDATKESLLTEQPQEDLGQSQSHTDPVAKELRALTAQVSDKMKTFEEGRARAQEKLKEISRLYTIPSNDPKQPPHEKYTLRGVSTGANVVYVLEKTKPDEEDDMLSTEAKDWQWWKIEYLSTETKPVVPGKVTEADVLKAASTDSRSALLVYANDKAVSYESGDLPSPLHNFVRADNLSFSAELDGLDPPAPATPTKRKADDNDLDMNNHRSPPYDRTYDPISNDDLDPNPPGYDSSPSPPHLPIYPRISPRKVGMTGSYDDVIPTSLRATGPTIDPTSMALDQDGTNDRGQEMKERGRKGVLHRQKNVKEKQEYSLGSYVPEITMEDDEEDEDQRGSKDI